MSTKKDCLMWRSLCFERRKRKTMGYRQKKIMKKWKSRIGRWKFDRKMRVLITVAIMTITLILLLVSTVSSVSALKNKSVELLQARNRTLAENVQSTLEEYKELSVAMVLDRSIQSYVLSGSGAEEALNTLQVKDAQNVMASCLNMKPDMNFIAVVSYGTGDYLYRGKAGLATTEFQKVYKQDYLKSKNPQETTMKMRISNVYFKGAKYTMNVYFPVYYTGRLMDEKGLLCMNFSSPVLEQILEEEENAVQKTEIVDGDGILFAAGETKNIGSKVSYKEKLGGNSGIFSQSGRLYSYEKVGDWNYYIISSLDSMELYKPSLRVIAFMAFVTFLLVLFSLAIVKKVIEKVYRPLDKVVRKMDDVAAGSLAVRINTEHMGEDFIKLAQGFNSMMEEIAILMEQVKQEQHQMEQIRFNSLQSQIQPHFLYNTLDCIHWQAMADGNQEVSTMVKALARYYRICLSKGHDIISLKMEMEHVQNYLIIQNMRYDNIIGSEIRIEQECEEIRIPKLTLQPLIENSIYHGIKVKEGKKGSILIDVKKEGKTACITLADTGTGMTGEQIDEMNQHLSEHDETFGYGVRNVNKRIELLFGEEYGLYYLKNKFGGVTVEIHLPYQTEADDMILQGDTMNV